MLSLQRSQIKYYSSLKLKKFRDQEQLFIAEGEKLAQEIVLSGKKIKALIAVDSWLEANASLLKKTNAEIFRASEADFERISNFKTPNRVLVVMPQWQHEFPKSFADITLVLDDIQDPGNLGTIIRLADWFGISHIICSENTVELFNPKVIQSTMGAFLRVKVHYSALDRFIQHAKGKANIRVYGAFLNGNNLYESKLKSPAFIIMGNESKGIGAELEKITDEKITIPCYSKQGESSESLNVATATAIICSEFRRLIH